MYLYFMVPEANPDLIKIGITSDIKSRKSALEAASGRPLHVLWSIPMEDRQMALDSEKAVHLALAQWRRKGEWFEYNDHTILFLMGLKEFLEAGTWTILDEAYG